MTEKFFTNTYVTNGGRLNYLNADYLRLKSDYIEDPLFTSFTFDIDYVTSPLFYTIEYGLYGYPNVEGMGKQIEDNLAEMYNKYMGQDQGYDILPVLSASILDGNKLGFGLQQNVYMDKPLYGAVEYIYMVDKRNGAASQNDVKYDSDQIAKTGTDPNDNSYKLGDSLKEIVNDSDVVWAERQKKYNEDIIKNCDKIMAKTKVVTEHETNKTLLQAAQRDYETYKKSTKEEELQKQINALKDKQLIFEKLKKDIVDWVNSELSRYQNEARKIYQGNACIQEIFAMDDLSNSNKDDKAKYLEGDTKYGSAFRSNYIYSDGYTTTNYNTKFIDLYNTIVTVNGHKGYDKSKPDDGVSLLVDYKSNDGAATVRSTLIINKFKDTLKQLDLLDANGNLNGSVSVMYNITPEEDWVYKFYSQCSYFVSKDAGKIMKQTDSMIQNIMSYQCDINTAFGGNFVANDDTAKLEDLENQLDQASYYLYGWDERGVPCDISNPSPDSLYGKYLAAKDAYENDAFSQAQNAKSLADAGAAEMQRILTVDEHNEGISTTNYNEAIASNIQPTEINRTKSIAPSQTVLDMLGFISGMKKMTTNYPYIIQGITGLDNAYKNHYFIKDPYLGSGDDKITLTCLESLDLRVSSMFNRYFNAVYDRQYRRERVPVNLRRFNCTVYVHDVRNFVNKQRKGVSVNKVLELTDMYHSVIEFRFYDCEIVPEETGNIFDNISNEAPSEMKKTNFTFTYGNCVVNFIPPSEVAAYNAVNR